MSEGAMLGEMTKPVENPIKNILTKKVFKRIDDLGSQFYTSNHRRDKNLGDWKINNDKGSIKRKLDFFKGEKNQHLTINFEKQIMTGFDFTLSDGKTIINLKKNEEGKLIVSRKNKKGESVSGSDDLSLREYIELLNFPVKLQFDRSVNSIVNTVDPHNVIRYATPVALTVSFAGHSVLANFAKPNDTISVNQTSILKQNIDDRPVIKLPEKELNFEFRDFFDSAKKEIINGSDLNTSKMDELGSTQEMEIITRFYQPGEKKDGQILERDIRKYLKNLKSNNRYVYRQYEENGSPGKALVGDLEKVLIEIRNNPYSQKSIYDLFDALHQYNTGKSLVTPDQIMLQAGIVGSGQDTSFQDVWDTYWQNPEVFQAGPIKGYSVLYETVLTGDLLVSENLIGRVMSIGKESLTVWIYDQKSGSIKITSFSPDNFPNPSLGFR